MNYKKISSDINIIFNFFYSSFNNINIYSIQKNEEFINLTFIFIFNIIFLLKKLLNILEITIEKNNIYKNQYTDKIEKLIQDIDIYDNNILNLYNNFNKKKNIENNNNSNNINNNLEFNINNNIKNLDLDDLDELINNIDNYNFSLIEFNKTNYIKYDYVDLGFNNYYKLHIFDKLNENIPFNLLVYIIEIDQIVIKVGDEKKFRFINSKIYKTYDIKINNDNSRSILCNNNIKELNKKCNNYNCSYYHDYILGYKENCHFDRQFSNNPIVFNSPNFKDGSKIKENAKTVDWYNAINLYQFNLSCLLLGCIHSLNK